MVTVKDAIARPVNSLSTKVPLRLDVNTFILFPIFLLDRRERCPKVPEIVVIVAEKMDG